MCIYAYILKSFICLVGNLRDLKNNQAYLPMYKGAGAVEKKLGQQYYFAHVSWDVIGYQGLFCPSNQPFCQGVYRGLKAVVGECSWVKMVIIMGKIGVIFYFYSVFKVITLFYLVLVYLTHIYFTFFYPNPLLSRSSLFPSFSPRPSCPILYYIRFHLLQIYILQVNPLCPLLVAINVDSSTKTSLSSSLLTTSSLSSSRYKSDGVCKDSEPSISA